MALGLRRISARWFGNNCMFCRPAIILPGCHVTPGLTPYESSTLVHCAWKSVIVHVNCQRQRPQLATVRLLERLLLSLRFFWNVNRCLLISFRKLGRSCCVRLQETSSARGFWTAWHLMTRAQRFLETSGIDHPTTRVTHEIKSRKVPDSSPAVPESRNDHCCIHSILALDPTWTT